MKKANAPIDFEYKKDKRGNWWKIKHGRYIRVTATKSEPKINEILDEPIKLKTT